MTPEEHWLTQILLKQIPTPSINFSKNLWEVAKQNGVLALCAHNLKQSPLWQTCDPDLQQALMLHNKQMTILELLQQKELNHVLQQLANANLPVLLIKGTPLAYSLYEKPVLRQRCDTDLLFADQQSAETAWKILERLGYQRPNTINAQLISHEFTCKKIGSLDDTHVLDIHWKLNNIHLFANTLTFDTLMRSAISIPNFIRDARTICMEHALLLACMHRLAHAIEGTSNRLIWLYDIHLIASQFNLAQWQIFLQLCTDTEQNSTSLDGLQQAKIRFHTVIPQQVMEQLVAHAALETVTPEDIGSNLKLQWLNFTHLPSWKARIQLVYQHLFPATDYMLMKYKTTHRWQLPYLYLKRIIQGVPKQF